MAKRALVLIFAGCIFLAGCTLLLYPTVSQWLNSLHQSEIIADYTDSIGDLDDEMIEQELRRAKEYNDDLTEAVSMADPFQDQDAVDNSGYADILNYTAEGIMGYIEIPKINVLLPIYHGVSSDVLSKGVGHLPETSLPVGGESTHAVLAGHSGMSNARLFTDLSKLAEGDVFYIHIYTKTLTYTVDQVKTVLPTDTSDLTVSPCEDYVTLVTCTPIGVNSHRLLVRGTRTE
jgi:LPXTG-site transpeptidase (sortase) family protein